MMEFLALIPYELGTEIATWAAMVATLALGGAGFLNMAKENEGMDMTAQN